MSYQSGTLATASEGLYDITRQVAAIVAESRVQTGLCTVFCPHTTAAVTINENADPDVQHDLLLALALMAPDRPQFRHAEGNSAAHLKASIVGNAVTVIIDGGQLVLGTWQGIYFCEFDGPRQRRYEVKIVAD